MYFFCSVATFNKTHMNDQIFFFYCLIILTSKEHASKSDGCHNFIKKVKLLYIYYILNFQFSATCNIPLHSGRNSSYSLYCCLLMYDFLDNSDRQSVCIVERGH